MNQPHPPLLARLGVLTDPVRCRLLLLLENHELMVGELCSILQIPQSTVSRHLKMLSEGQWVTSRRDGTSHLYTQAPHGKAEEGPQLWRLVRQSVLETTGAAQDALRLQGVLAERRTRSQQFFASAAHRWDQLRAELFGRHFSGASLLGLLDPDWVVGDLGCGTGEVTAALAPFVRQVMAVDESAEMLQGARGRLAPLANTELRAGALEQLPLEESSLDAAVLMLVLHHLPDPLLALLEAGRVLRAGGRLLIVDMCPHDRDEYKQQMGHLWLGFSEATMKGYLHRAGFEKLRFHPLAPETGAKGPALFTATARRGPIVGGRAPGRSSAAESIER